MSEMTLEMVRDALREYQSTGHVFNAKSLADAIDAHLAKDVDLTGYRVKFMTLLAEAWVHGKTEGEIGDQCIKYFDELAALAHPCPTAVGSCWTCGETIQFDELTGTTCACGRRAQDEAFALHLGLPAPTGEQVGEVISTDNFGLTAEQIDRLRMKSLKPDAISGDGVAQAERVGELVAWFARLATGSANPKWTSAHAYELAYYVATHAESRKIDIGATRSAAYLEGVTISDGDRRMLERIGAVPTQPRPMGVPNGWKYRLNVEDPKPRWMYTENPDAIAEIDGNPDWDVVPMLAAAPVAGVGL